MNTPTLIPYARLFLCAVIGLALAASGCSRRPPPPAAAPAAPESAGLPPEDPVASVFMRADALLAQGGTNAAVALYTESMAAPELAAYRASFFDGLLRTLLASGQLQEAQRRLQEVLASDPELARAGMGRIYGYLMEHGRRDEMIAWTDAALALPALPAEFRSAFRELNLMGLVARGDDERVLRQIELLLANAPADDAIGLTQRTIDALFDQQRSGLVERILQLAGKPVTSDPAIQSLLAFTRIRLLAARGDWATLKIQLPAVAAKLGDDDLQRLMRGILAPLRVAGDTTHSDPLCEQMLTLAAGKPQTLDVTARQWIENAMATDKAALPTRLEALQRANVSAQLLCQFHMNYFYDIIGDPAVVRPMKELGMRLMLLADDAEVRNGIRTRVLDACFVLEDYATALQMLQEGIAGRDAAWHAMAISKVKAHQALKENNPREAVRCFREFMVTVMSAKDEDTSDPATGIVHSKEMILGRNAKRIGDILASIPDPAGAQQAYAEARSYYTQALAKAKDAPATRQIVEREMAATPQ